VIALLAIDPGYSKTGQGSAVARFNSSVPLDDLARLVGVWFVRSGDVDRPAGVRAHGRARVVWECPQLDARSRKATPAVVQLAAEGGEIAGAYAAHYALAIERVTPSQWKGSVPKPIAHSRLWRVLDDRERDVLGGDNAINAIERAKLAGARDRWGKEGARYYPRSFVMHNLLDAVGIGLWALGRWTT
jgi:hypothetical protein